MNRGNSRYIFILFSSVHGAPAKMDAAAGCLPQYAICFRDDDEDDQSQHASRSRVWKIDETIIRRML